MRAFRDRLICDACGGMMIGVDDFAQALAGVGSLRISVVDDTPTELLCPRGDGRLRSCRVHADEASLDQDVLHCRHHGLWLAGGILEAVLRQRGVVAHRS